MGLWPFLPLSLPLNLPLTSEKSLLGNYSKVQYRAE